MKKIFTGTVLSNRMKDTIVVEVEETKKHPLYGKRYKRLKKYYVHDIGNKAQIGDKVEIQEARPISKTKSWILIKILD